MPKVVSATLTQICQDVMLLISSDFNYKSCTLHKMAQITYKFQN